MYWPRIGFAAFFLAAVLSAQQPAAPRFDVVSIRAVPPNAPTVMRDFEFTPVLPGGQYVDSRAWLPLMIAFAYDMVGYNDTHFPESPPATNFLDNHHSFSSNGPTAQLWGDGRNTRP